MIFEDKLDDFFKEFRQDEKWFFPHLMMIT